MEEDGKKELLSKSELSIWLDNYDDIFSDFDPRPFTERVLSDDFISEVRKRALERVNGKVELKLLIPAGLRDAQTENIIIQSLHRHFHYVSEQIRIEMKQERYRGYGMTLAGFAVMIVATYLISWERHFYLNALRVIMEPAGWFLAWTGFEHIFYLSRRKSAEYAFNRKMSHADVAFLPL